MVKREHGADLLDMLLEQPHLIALQCSTVNAVNMPIQALSTGLFEKCHVRRVKVPYLGDWRRGSVEQAMGEIE